MYYPPGPSNQQRHRYSPRVYGTLENDGSYYQPYPPMTRITQHQPTVMTPTSPAKESLTESHNLKLAALVIAFVSWLFIAGYILFAFIDKASL